MPAAHRHKDICTGHGCFPSRPNASASGNVFVNNKGAHRVGDFWEVHCCLHGDTEIYTTHGYISISKIHEMFHEGIKLETKSKFESTVIPSKIVASYLTKYTDTFIKVTLESGETIEVTPDHKFLLSDGVTYVEAQDLKETHEL